MSNKLVEHKHCKICQLTIPAKSEPRVCSEEECIQKHERNERNEKQMRIMMFVFFGFFALSFIGPMLLR